MTRPFINVPHHIELGRTLRLYPAALVEPFAAIMASLYPRLASTVTVKRGYAAWADAGFIGIMTSTGLTSVRRNPLLVDDTQLFLRALLAGMAVDGLKTWSAYCDWDNYGTLRLMQKLGLGAKHSRSGHLSAYADRDTVEYLQQALEVARTPYLDHREYAVRKLHHLTPDQTAALMPPEPSVTPVAELDVTL
jgi:hypothetical protein